MFPKSGSASVKANVAEHGDPPPRLLLTAPGLGSDVMIASPGEALLLEWFSPEGVHVLPARFVTLAGEETPVWQVEIDGEVVVTNRRRFVRTQKDGTTRTHVSGRALVVEMVDISEGGVRCFVPFESTGGKPPDGVGESSSAEVSLDLSAKGAVALNGSVAWVRHGSTGVEFAVAFGPMNDDNPLAGALRRHILELQRQQRRRAMDEE